MKRVLIIDKDANPGRQKHTHDGLRMRKLVTRRLRALSIDYAVSEEQIPWKQLAEHYYRIVMVHNTDLTGKLGRELGNLNECVVGVFTGESVSAISLNISPASVLVRWQVTPTWLERLEELGDECPNVPDDEADTKDWGKFIQACLLLCDDLDTLSSTIHAIDNLLLPLRLDYETLATADKEVTDEIRSDYFREPGGYLTTQCDRIGGRSIVAVVKDRLCDLGALAEDPDLVTAREKLCNTVAQVRASQKTSPPGNLRNDLNAVLGAGCSVVKRLRELRTTKEGTGE